MYRFIPRSFNFLVSPCRQPLASQKGKISLLLWAFLLSLAANAMAVPTTPRFLGTSVDANFQSIKLSWEPSTSAFAITYKISINGRLDGQTTQATYSTRYAAGTAYSFAVEACDGSGCSGVATVPLTTPQVGTGSPSVVTLSRTSTSITAQWPAAANAVSYILDRVTVPTLSFSTFGVSTTSFTNTNLTPGQTYRYQVKACFANGTCTAPTISDPLLFIGTPQTPPTPGAITASINFSTLSLNWGASSGAFAYRVMDNGSAKIVTTNSAVLTNLSSTVHSIEVAACGVPDCTSNLSTASKLSVDMDVPTNGIPAMTSLTASPQADGTVALFYGLRKGADIYKFEKQIISGAPEGAPWVSIGWLGNNTTSKIVEHLSGPHNYRVKACASPEESSCSAWVVVQNITASPTPPSNIQVANLGSSVKITWDSLDATSYGIAVFSEGNPAPIFTGSATTKSITINNLVLGQSYRVEIQASAKDQFNNTLSSGMTAKVIMVPPTPASAVTATHSGSTFALSWGSATGATSYKIFRDNQQIAAVTSSPFVDSGLLPIPGQFYSYGVQACHGDSNCAAVVKAANIGKPPAAPSNLSAIFNKDTEATFNLNSSKSIAITWNASAGAARYEVERYELKDNIAFATSVTGNSFTDQGVVYGPSYRYGVRACAATGCSELTRVRAITLLNVLAVYNPAYAADEASARVLVENEMKITNDAYAQSGVNLAVRLAGLLLVNDNNTDSMGERLAKDANGNPTSQIISNGYLRRMSAGSDVFAPVAKARFDHKADLVVFYHTLNPNSDWCGLGWIGGQQGPYGSGAFKDYASLMFSTSRTDNCSIYTTPHEFGHNLGLNHSRKQNVQMNRDNNGQPTLPLTFALDGNGKRVHFSGFFDFAVGYGEQDRFVSVMAYESFFGAPRLGLFSNPDISCQPMDLALPPSPCGIDRTLINQPDYLRDGADARYALNISGPQVAAYSDTLVDPCPTCPIGPSSSSKASSSLVAVASSSKASSSPAAAISSSAVSSSLTAVASSSKASSSQIAVISSSAASSSLAIVASSSKASSSISSALSSSLKSSSTASSSTAPSVAFHLRGTHNGWLEGDLLTAVAGSTTNLEICRNFVSGDSNGGPRFKVDPNGGWGSDSFPAADVATSGWTKIVINSSTRTIVSFTKDMAANCGVAASSSSAAASSSAQAASSSSINSSSGAIQIIMKPNVQTVSGQNIFIVGNQPELSNWNKMAGVPCTTTAATYPVWTCQGFTLAAGTAFEYKYIKRDAAGTVIYESGGNRTRVAPTTSTTYSETWK